MPESDVRASILRAATQLFAQKGYGSTSVREVVEAAGVTKPTLYYWFDSKEKLFVAVVNLHLENLERMVADVVEGPGTVRQRLELFVERFITGALESRDAVRLLMTVQYPTDDDQPTVDIMSMHLRKVEQLGRLLAEGVATGEIRAEVDPRLAVLALIGIVNLQCMAALHGMPVGDITPAHIVDIFLRGVGT